MTLLAILILIAAVVPAFLFVWNLLLFRRAPAAARKTMLEVSVLIPARNEERNVGRLIESVLANRGVKMEVLVLDDASEDRTAEIVGEWARKDSRVRLIHGKGPPSGWAGKPYACHLLGQASAYPLLVFLDADVRLSSDALNRLAAFMECSGADLASGIPRQITGTLMDKLLIPLIHFILLCYLPLWGMRRSRSAAFGAGCGQLFVARRDSYLAMGGHQAVAGHFHDGLHLPRAFRRAGLRTDLVDVTDLATCRMYQTNGEVWPGLAKTAVEGMAAPRVIGPFSGLLLLGQIAPFIVLAVHLVWSVPLMLWLSGGVGMVCGLGARMWAAVRFKQSWVSALMHPAGVLVFLGINWWALLCHWLGKPIHWKGRARVAARRGTEGAGSLPEVAVRVSRTSFIAVALLLWPFLCGAEVEMPRGPDISLKDQFGREHTISFPNETLVVLTVADRKGYEQMPGWIAALKQKPSKEVRVIGVADLKIVPRFIRPLVRKRFVEEVSTPVLLDWSGEIAQQLGARGGQPNVYLLDRAGHVKWRASGSASEKQVNALFAAMREYSTPRAARTNEVARTLAD